MRYLHGVDEENASVHIREAEKQAVLATCTRAKCGTVIVGNNHVIGLGFNSPPASMESQRRCTVDKSSYDKKVTDKTCCMHAEQRAILDALTSNSNRVKGATLYFARVDENGKSKAAGKPYCTLCSKLALDVGISEFVLQDENGICAYGTEEYNDISFNYKPEI